MQATAHFLIWTICLSGSDRLYACLSDQQEIQGERPVDDDHRLADDAVTCGCRQFLDLPVSAANRAVQLCGRVFHGRGSFQLFHDRGGRSGALVNCDCRHMDVDALCDADLSGGSSVHPDSIYEAAECDRASKWRQFWTITIPDGPAVPDAGGAVSRHRELQDVRSGCATDRWRPGNTTDVDVDRSQA